MLAVMWLWVDSREIGMSIQIHSKRLGINRCYVVKADGCTMIDTGPPMSERAIENWIRAIPINPQEIELIVLTHGHADHVGAASGVRSITGARIALHKYDKDMFENGIVVWPSAVTTWGHVARVLLKPLMPLFRFQKGRVDIVICNEGLSLAEYGIPGKVIHTPGHTPGSVSVVLETGDAFVGCMTHSGSHSV